ncbi:hypothetical protein SABIM44S_03917 [Streptomyces abikoensis]
MTPAGGALLAVDAGNSKTDVALVGPDGAVLGAARGGGFQPQGAGVRSAVDGLAELVERAVAGPAASSRTPPTSRRAWPTATCRRRRRR